MEACKRNPTWTRTNLFKGASPLLDMRKGRTEYIPSWLQASIDACATELTHATQNAFRLFADRHPLRRTSNARSNMESRRATL